MSEVRMIDANALREVIETYRPIKCFTDKDIGKNRMVDYCLSEIDNAPTVNFDYLIKNAPDVIRYDGNTGKITTRPQGEWLMESELYGGFGDSVLVITCSICKESFIYRGKTSNFCPNCGARMTKGDQK